jgi:hypothetical protein
VAFLFEDRLQVESDGRIVFQDQNTHARTPSFGPSAGPTLALDTSREVGTIVPTWSQPVRPATVPGLTKSIHDFQNLRLRESVPAHALAWEQEDFQHGS